MLLSEQKQRLRNYFGNDVYYTDDDLQASIDDGYQEICAYTGLLLKSTILNFTANKTYYDMRTLIPDYLGVVAIFNEAIKRWMLPSSIRKFDEQRIDWETAAGVPYYFAPVSHRYVAIYKKPIVANYGRMFVFYRATAPDTAGTDDVFLLPGDHQFVLEDYSIADLEEQNQEWGKAAVRVQSYKERLDRLRIWVRNKRIPDRLPNLK